MGTDKSSVALKWSPPSTDGGDSVDYIIEYRRQGSSTWKRANSVPVQETNFSVPGLKEGDEYEFRITAQNKAGLGPSSEISQAVRVETPLGMFLLYFYPLVLLLSYFIFQSNILFYLDEKMITVSLNIYRF
jgi:hypothetical protein